MKLISCKARFNSGLSKSRKLLNYQRTHSCKPTGLCLLVLQEDLPLIIGANNDAGWLTCTEARKSTFYGGYTLNSSKL